MPKYSIVGQKWKNLDPKLPGIEAGVRALLIREPQNPYDQYAVQVWIDGQHVGYIPGGKSREVSERVDREGAQLALDIKPGTPKSLNARFVRSPNSGYPMVEIP